MRFLSVPLAAARCLICALVCASSLSGASLPNPLEKPAVGAHQLNILSPRWIELSLVTTKDPDPAKAETWAFPENGLPSPGEFRAQVNGKPVKVQTVGFKRRPVYAPLRKRDLRIGNWLYLELDTPLKEGGQVQVQSVKDKHWPSTMKFAAEMDPNRFNPAIHVNQTGYMPNLSKKAMIGYYLGSAGELPIASRTFHLVEASSGKTVFSGKLQRRPDVGFVVKPAPYQQVWEADFSAFNQPGEYQLKVPGMGLSRPFLIDEGIAANLARTYALGLLHQRCGQAKTLPLTRYGHEACHTEPAEIPTARHQSTQLFISQAASEARNQKRHTAPVLTNFSALLFPYIQRGTVDVSGGHHDAGDYSKYTINSAGLIHHLVFAADAFSGAGGLDNLGIPESGDGKSDLLQIAKWEADFLAKMQDKDGGFYFLVYPRDRKYEDDVLPDQGDRQVVWPKNTAATAAAVAALAQTASSPLFKKQFPEAARAYLAGALRGWDFLEKALERHGRDGAYQRITHYGNEFMHDDELAWAATELFLATGEKRFHQKLLESFDPADRETWRWTWWRLYESYGNAIRSYAFAAQTGRRKQTELDSTFLKKCQEQILTTAEDQVRWASESTYGTSFPDPSKRVHSAGWYFSSDRAFDIATGIQLGMAEPQRERHLDGLLTNLNYEMGCNPVNVSFITGLGWKRPRDIVHQYAQNDPRILPPSGIPLGNIATGFQFLHHYERELGHLTFPEDSAEEAPYPLYDRWGDSFNVTTEFVIVNQARALATAAFLMARSPLAGQTWKQLPPAAIAGLDEPLRAGETFQASLAHPPEPGARTLWEIPRQEPAFGNRFSFTPDAPGKHVLEVEILFPDGRRQYGRRQLEILPPQGEQP